MWKAAVAIAALYALLLLVLLVAGRRGAARDLARMLPDCVRLIARLARDREGGRGVRVVAVATLAYLSLPFDLVPDFVPVAGQLDDVIIVLLALRWALRRAGAARVAELWPGSEASLRVLLRATGAR